MHEYSILIIETVFSLLIAAVSLLVALVIGTFVLIWIICRFFGFFINRDKKPIFTPENGGHDCLYNGKFPGVRARCLNCEYLKTCSKFLQDYGNEEG